MKRSLDPRQIEQFWRDGYLLLPEVLPADTLRTLAGEFEAWKEESRAHARAFGTTLDQRPRFDVEPGHCAERPALRRIASPIEISDAYLDVMRNNAGLDAVAEIIGPNVRFNNAKINSKLPGAATQVKFHQDFLFEPRSNDDMITVLMFIDDVVEENGPLQVVPGTHRGPLHEHWHDGVFTGMLSEDAIARLSARAVSCHGPAGSACLMHTRLVHGSGPNRSERPRTLFICEYCAEDSRPLQANSIPSRYMEEIVRGEFSGRVRCSEYDMAFPEIPEGASFFEQQAKAAQGAKVRHAATGRARTRRPESESDPPSAPVSSRPRP